MIRQAKGRRRSGVLFLVLLVILVLAAVFLLPGLGLVGSKSDPSTKLSRMKQQLSESLPSLPSMPGTVDVAQIGAIHENIMPKLSNETLRADLGRHSWYLFHTILARFPEEPSQEERTALQDYVFLFGKLYPCGDCGKDFLQLLLAFPPQTSSRYSAAMWGCAIHNKVNRKLSKDDYDCSLVLDQYDCGCGPGGSTADKIQEKGKNA